MEEKKPNGKLNGSIFEVDLRFPCGICGNKSVRGVVQFTPFRLRVAFV